MNNLHSELVYAGILPRLSAKDLASFKAANKKRHALVPQKLITQKMRQRLKNSINRKARTYHRPRPQTNLETHTKFIKNHLGNRHMNINQLTNIARMKLLIAKVNSMPNHRRMPGEDRVPAQMQEWLLLQGLYPASFLAFT